MARLLVRLPDGENREVPLDKTKTSIGRSSRNDICISDPFASRLHAEVRCDGDNFFLTDMGSANGTFCNGDRVLGTIPLHMEDTIQIGETRITLAEDPPFSASKEILLSDHALYTEAEFTFAGRRSAEIFSVIEEVASNQKMLNTGGNVNTGDNRISPKTMFTSLNQEAEEADSQRSLLAIVSRVGVTLLSDTSLDETLNRVMDLVFDAVPIERGFLFLYEGKIRRTPKYHQRHNSGEALTCKVGRSNTKNLTIEEVPISRSISDKVLNERTSILTSDAMQDPRFQEMQSLATKMRSIMAVPLAINDEVLGMIYVDNPYTNRFSQDNLLVITAIASVAAIKIENARLLEERIEKKRMEEELKVASEIQLRLQPVAPPRVNGYELIGISFPCREIGGDYYDFIPRKKGRLLLALGDVSGKGIGAALLMSSLHAAFHAQVQNDFGPAEIVEQINNYIVASSPENKFLTLFCAELDPPTGRLTYCNAGHNAPILISHNGEASFLETGGLPLGITTDIGYDQSDLILQLGDVLTIYSDGITESVNQNDEEFGEKRLIEVIQRFHHRTASQIRDRIDEAVTQFAGNTPVADDTTIMIVKRSIS
jgi:phosphoserine phosphatase RsbU/P